MRPEGREPLPDKAGESTLPSRSGGEKKARELRTFLKTIGTPVTLAEMNVPLDRDMLHDCLIEATTGPDMAHIPYPITPDMVFDAMIRVENM